MKNSRVPSARGLVFILRHWQAATFCFGRSGSQAAVMVCREESWVTESGCKTRKCPSAFYRSRPDLGNFSAFCPEVQSRRSGSKRQLMALGGGAC